MLSVEALRQHLFQFPTVPLGTERLTLNKALGRYCAISLRSDLYLPNADNSAMDGYALHCDEPISAGTTLPVTLKMAAGATSHTLAPGSAARIFTGAQLPIGANTVVIQEECEASADKHPKTDKLGAITLLAPVNPGDNVRPKGQDIKSGDTLCHAGDRLSPQLIALLAACGHTTVEVYQPLRVGILTTGSELAEPGSPLTDGQLYNSNGPMLTSLCEQLGCLVTHTANVPDTLEETKDALQACAQHCDVIITSGGVSVGDEDHIKNAIQSLGQLDIWKVKLKPGKPLAFGRIEDTPILSLPGNPSSSFVTFCLFAKSFVVSRYGQPYRPLQLLKTPADFTVDTGRKRPEFARAKIEADGIRPHPNQSSGMISPLSWADGLVFIDADTTIQPKDLVPFISMQTLLN